VKIQLEEIMKIDMEIVNEKLESLKEELFDIFNVILEFHNFDKFLESVYEKALDAIYSVNKGCFYRIDIETIFHVEDYSFHFSVIKSLEGKKRTSVYVFKSWGHFVEHGSVWVLLKYKRGCPKSRTSL
jgi:hypothetical protein